MTDSPLYVTKTKTTTTTTTVTTETWGMNDEASKQPYIEHPAEPAQVARALPPSGTPLIGPPTTNAIKTALAGIPAQNYFLHADEVITLQSRTKIPDAVHRLVEYGISSAPVLDDSERCIGLFDMSDVLDFVVQVFDETAPLGDNFLAQLEQTTRMSIEPCSTIVNSSKRDQYFPVSVQIPLVEAIMLLDTHNLHRVPVVDSTGQITSLITQSGVLQWFAYNMEKLGPVPKQRIQDIMLGYKPVVMVNGNEPAIEVYRLMKKRGISSVAVVGNEQKLITVVSTSDLKSVTSDPALISRLHLPILSYLTLLYPEGNHPPVVCSVRDTVEQVMTTIVSKKIHRVYLVDSREIPATQQQPVGIITLRDIIHVLMQEDASKAVF